MGLNSLKRYGCALVVAGLVGMSMEGAQAGYRQTAAAWLAQCCTESSLSLRARKAAIVGTACAAVSVTAAITGVREHRKIHPAEILYRNCNRHYSNDVGSILNESMLKLRKAVEQIGGADIAVCTKDPQGKDLIEPLLLDLHRNIYHCFVNSDVREGLIDIRRDDLCFTLARLRAEKAFDAFEEKLVRSGIVSTKKLYGGVRTSPEASGRRLRSVVTADLSPFENAMLSSIKGAGYHRSEEYRVSYSKSPQTLREERNKSFFIAGLAGVVSVATFALRFWHAGRVS